MINPDNNNELNNDDAEDQRSQQDIQSNGIDDVPASEQDVNASELDNLSQADRASESSFTLNLGDDTAAGKSDKA